MSYLLPKMNRYVAALLSAFVPFLAMPFGSYPFGVTVFYATTLVSLWLFGITVANCIRRFQFTDSSERWLTFIPVVIALWWPLGGVAFVARKLGAILVW
jgi:hypothetical protein